MDSEHGTIKCPTCRHWDGYNDRCPNCSGSSITTKSKLNIYYNQLALKFIEEVGSLEEAHKILDRVVKWAQ